MSTLTLALGLAVDSPLGSTLSVGLVVSSFAFGLRHGFDWDHIAAISDLSGSAANRRRGLALSMLYAVGHGAVVLAIGFAIIVLGAALPDQVASALDNWMGRVVGATLFGLGFWILVELVRKGRDFRLRSRWMLILQGTFAGFRRVHRSFDRSSRRLVRHVEVEHEHRHEHVEAEHTDHGDQQAHDHAHIDSDELAELPTPVLAARASGSSGLSPETGGHADGHSHSHSHSHRLTLRNRLAELGQVGGGTAVGVGVLHGVGIESPTQIAVFTASTAVGGTVGAVALLVAWVIGLIVANGMLAVAAGFGLLQAERYFNLYAALAVAVAVLSMAMGVALMTGFETPSIF